MLMERDGGNAGNGAAVSVALNRRRFIKSTVVAGAGVAAAPRIDALPFRPPQNSGEDLSRQEREWTFEAASKLWESMKTPVQHVGVPGFEWQIGVLWDGGLICGPLSGFRNSAVMRQEIASLGENRLNLTIGHGDPPRFGERAGVGDPNVRRGLIEGRLPLPRIERNDGDLFWVQTVSAHLVDRKIEEGMTPSNEDIIFAQARFRVRNTGHTPSIGHLWLHFGDTSDITFGYKMGRADEIGSALAQHFEAPYGIIENRWYDPPFGTMKNDVRYVVPKPAKGELHWHDQIPPPAGMKDPVEDMIEWRVPLAAGEEADLWVIVPFGLLDRQSAAKLTSLPNEALWAAAQRFWKGVVETRIGTITTPDNFLNDYLAAVTGQMAEQIAYRRTGKIWIYKTSPNWYEAYWPVSAAWPLPTLDLRGLSQYSRPVLQSFIDTQSDDVGKLIRQRMGEGDLVLGEGFEKRPGFMGNFGPWTANTLLLSHGLGLWALASHFRITRDREWLEKGTRSPLRAIEDGCEWTMAQRRRTMREENGRKVAHWGLLPAASTHDWLSGNTICNDATCIYGMIESVRLLREIGHPRAEEIARDLNDYRACLRACYQAARDRARRVPLDDGSEIPYVPRDIHELDWAMTDWTYTGYGPARAGAWGAFDPRDELVDQTLAFIDAGLPKGQGYYLRIERDLFAHINASENLRDVNDPHSSRHFLCKHYVEPETMVPIFFDLFLQRDDLPRFFEWLFNNVAVAIHKDFRVGVESIDGAPSCAPGDGVRWRAVRNMFVNEMGGYDGSQQSLWLLQAIPRSWLKPGNSIGVEHMGTHFGGQVDVSARVSKDGHSMDVQAHLDLAVAPKEIRVRLRSGDGRPLSSARVNGMRTTVLEGDMIQLPNGTKGSFRIVASFA